MRRILWLAGLMALVLSDPAQAQLVFTESDFQIPLGTRRDASTYTASPTIGTPAFNALQALAAQQGANQVYDLTGYTYDPPDDITTFFQAIDATTPEANNPAYVGADYVDYLPQALNPSAPADVYNFVSVDATGFYLHGNVAVGFSRTEQVPPEQDLALPLTFGTQWVTMFQRTVTGPGINQVVDVKVTREVDGWGTLVTPVGAVPCLSILSVQEVTAGGTMLPPNTERIFITKDGIKARIGYDDIFQQWESVSYTVDTLTPPDDDPPDDGGGGNEGGVLLVVDEATNLGEADTVVDTMLEELGFAVEIVSDEAATTDDANDKDLIVISATVDPVLIAADWAATNVPLVTWEPEMYGALAMTNINDFGTTDATTVLTLLDATHPITRGNAGDFVVYTSAAPKVWGTPGTGAAIVAGSGNEQATIFTYEAGATMVGMAAPARRVGFFMNDAGPSLATENGMILLKNAVLWAVGRETCDLVSSVAIEQVGQAVPTAFRLAGNYPNPFNPATVIPFEVATASPVQITVYNVLGQHVATLVDESLPAGAYTVDFSAGDLPSGVYLYQLRAHGIVQSRTMLLQK